MFYKLRSRPDKMNPNYKIAANDFWNDINNPIPITALSKIKLNLENSSQEWTGFRDYSKKSKKELIEKNIEKSSIVIDVGFGKGGDLEKYMSHGIKNIIGVEPDNKNIDEFLYRNRNYKTTRNWLKAHYQNFSRKNKTCAMSSSSEKTISTLFLVN